MAFKEGLVSSSTLQSKLLNYNDIKVSERKRRVEMGTKVEFKRIKNDVNGNPRYVCHFLDMDVHGAQSGLGLSERYEIAVKLANKIGGRRYHVKNYGGGLVFQSYSLDELVSAMARVTGKQFDGYKEV